MSGIHDRQKNISGVRANIEPVTFEKNGWAWQESGPHVVWNSADLPTNMAAVLARRMMDGARAGCDELPLDSKRCVSREAVAAFIVDEVDDRRIEDLLWGLVTINHRQKYPENLPHADLADAPPLPRQYALLKLLFLPRPLARQWDEERQRWKWRWAREGDQGVHIRPEPRVLPLLRSGCVDEACRIAYQRLRASGFNPLPGPTSSGASRQSDWKSTPSINPKPKRLAAALLLPVGDYVVNEMIHLTTRQDEEPETETLITKGAFES